MAFRSFFVVYLLFDVIPAVLDFRAAGNRTTIKTIIQRAVPFYCSFMHIFMYMVFRRDCLDGCLPNFGWKCVHSLDTWFVAPTNGGGM